MRHKQVIPALLAALAVSAGSVVLAAQSASAGPSTTASPAQTHTRVIGPSTATPIKHGPAAHAAAGPAFAP